MCSSGGRDTVVDTMTILQSLEVHHLHFSQYKGVPSYIHLNNTNCWPRCI